ncbi:MAG: anti-sigma factor domain-containing protein, partial [Pyrinomonadaceae bacterium]
VEQPAIALVAKTRDPIWGWLGWACAAAISLLLIANIWVTRSNKIEVAEDLPTATPEILTPAQSRERLVASASDIVKAEWGAGNMKDVAVAGDVVWSDAMQEGYVRLKGLPKNDASQSTYQLWIFEENQGKKTPIDGGTFNINSDGEVVIPIDAHLKAKNPGAFAVTIEKPGGVVVSEQGKVPTLAPVKPKSA